MYASIMTEERTTIPSSIGTTGSQMEVEGTVDERIHLTTLCVIHLLCPPHTRGGAFFAGLLANATITSQALPGLTKEARGDAAIVSVQGCAELSRLVRLSYDTTQKYLAIYRVLGLLYIAKQGKLTTITIPLAVYHSLGEIVERLRQLRRRYQHKRPKMLSLIDNMIERTASLVQEDEEQLPLTWQGQALPDSVEPLAPIQQVLSSEGVADPSGRIAMRILEALALANNGDSSQNGSRFASENLPVPQQENVCEVDSAAGESTSLTVPVSSSGRFDSENLPEPDQQDDGEVDSCELAPASPSAGREVRGRPVMQNLPMPDQGIAKVVDSLRRNVTFNDYHKYISLMKTNVTLQEQFQRFLALVLDDDETQWRRYNKLFESFSLNNPLQLEAIIATLVETLVIRYRDQSLKKPGGYFTARCKIYSKQIPPDVCNLVQTYGHMSCEELVSSLKTDAGQRKPQVFLSRQKHARRGGVRAPYGFSSQGTHGRGSKQALAEEQMSELEAKALEVRIKREAPFVQVQGIRQVFPAVYVLDVSIDDVPWTIASKQEWDRYYSELRACEWYASQVTETPGTVQSYSGSVQAQ